MYPAPDDGDELAAHRALARDLGLAHAQARAAGHLLGVDPAAAARAPRGVTRHTAAAMEALATTRLPRSGDADARGPRFEGLLRGFRAGGGALRVSVAGPARDLPPLAEAVVRQLAQDALTAAATHAPGWDLSFSLTWSTHRLDVLAVCGPGAGERSRPVAVPPDGFGSTRARVAAVAGTVRVTIPPAGGFLAAAAVPLPPSAADGTPTPTAGTVTSPVAERVSARITP